jgi:hypothetical protein
MKTLAFYLLIYCLLCGCVALILDILYKKQIPNFDQIYNFFAE